MNLFNYWLRVKGLYPQAVNDCVAHFQRSYPDDWKTHFKNPDQILAWLEKRQIQIITRKKVEYRQAYDPEREFRGHFRFELKAWEETTTTAFRFTSRENALYDAIERAFRILEQRALRQQSQPTQPYNPPRNVK